MTDKLLLKAHWKNSGFTVAFKGDRISSGDLERKLKVSVSNRSSTFLYISSNSDSPGHGDERGNAILRLNTGESGVLFTTSAADLIKSWGEINVSGTEDSLDVELVFDWLDGRGAPSGLMYNYTKIIPSL